MKINIFQKLILTCLIHISMIQVGQGQFFRQMSLVGVDSIEVKISIDNETELTSFARSLKNRAELRLRQNDIRIGSDEDATSLTFSVIILDIGFGDQSPVGKVARYDLELSKLATTKTQLLPSQFITWQGGGIFVTSVSNIESDLRNVLEEGLDVFLNEYLEVKQMMDE